MVGPRFEVDLPDGTRCVSQDGTPMSLNFYGGSSSRADNIMQKISDHQPYKGAGEGYALGAIFTVPLFTKNARDCDLAYALSMANKKIELATLLHEEGLLSDQDLKDLLQEVKAILLTSP